MGSVLFIVTPFCEVCDVTGVKLIARSRSVRSLSASLRFFPGENPRIWRFGRRIVPNRDLRFSERREPASSTGMFTVLRVWMGGGLAVAGEEVVEEVGVKV